MDLFGLSISTKATIQRAINTGVTRAATNLAQVGLYNEKIFNWINDNQVIFWEDNPLNYVKNGYQGNGDVYSCIDLILTKLCYCPILVYSVKAGQQAQAKKYKSLMTTDFAKAELYRMQTKALTEVSIPGIDALIAKPNEYQTTTEWLKQYAGFYLLNGNSYNYYNTLPGSKKKQAMYVLPAPLISIVSGGEFQPIKGYNVFNSYNYKTNGGVPDFPGADVSHIKTFNPQFTTYGSQLYGQSPLRAYILTLIRNHDSRVEQTRQAKNGGPFGILSPDTSNGAPTISDPKVKADLKKQLETAKNADDLISRLFVSGAPAKWLQIGLPSVDLQLLEAIGLDRIDICNAYHIPPQLMGNTEASTDNNMQWAMKQLIYNCVMTLGNTITDKLTRDICPAYETSGEKLMLMFDYSVLPELADDMSKIATALASMYWVTTNEKREFQGFGRSLDKYADKILVPKNYQLLEDIDLTDTTFTNANPIV